MYKLVCLIFTFKSSNKSFMIMPCTIYMNEITWNERFISFSLIAVIASRFPVAEKREIATRTG